MRAVVVVLLFVATGALAGNPPTLFLPSHVNVEATGPQGATASFHVYATAYGGAAASVTCSHASGALFPLGWTKVTCTAADDAGAKSTGDFIVNVTDTTPPSMTLPLEILVEASGPEGRIVTYETAATDIVDGTVTVRCYPPSGSLFAIRTTEVRCDAVDKRHNSSYGAFPVTVTDNAFPMLMLPGDMTVEATNPDGSAIVTFRAWAMDMYETTIPVACTPESGSLFPLGMTVVHCSATDRDERTSAGTFKVTVVLPHGEPPPTLHLPGNISVEATSEAGAVVTFTATATDARGKAIPVTCEPPSGSLFPIGTTVVHCTAREAIGIFDVVVTPRAPDPPPTLALPDDISVEATTNDGAVVTFTATARDEHGHPVDVTCAPPSGSLFPIGTTAVTCTARDASGTFDVTVTPRDTTAPVIHSITATPNVLWPVDRKFVAVTIAVDAIDDLDPQPMARITGVTVSEPAGNDVRITGALAVDLRAARSGSAADRIYTITVEVTDDAGNAATGTVLVRVPHDSGNDDRLMAKPAPAPPAPSRKRRKARDGGD